MGANDHRILAETALVKRSLRGYLLDMVELEDIVGGEWAEWYRLTPLERWHESQKLWTHYLEMGGSLDPEPDSQSPFYDGRSSSPRPVDGRPGVRVLRRGGI